MRKVSKKDENFNVQMLYGDHYSATSNTDGC
jgi:hypothetical protein